MYNFIRIFEKTIIVALLIMMMIAIFAATIELGIMSAIGGYPMAE